MKSTNAAVLMNALDGIDPALLYNARTYTPKKPRVIRIAAAIAACLVLVAGLTVYGVFMRPASTVTVDSQRGVTLSLNAAGYVVEVSPDAADLNAAKGQKADAAVHTVIGAMVRSRSLSSAENTVILGFSERSDQEMLLTAADDALKKEHIDGAVLSLCTVPDSHKPMNMTDGKYTLLCEIAKCDEHLRADSLRGLSPTALALLMDAAGTVPDGVTLTGTPSTDLLIDSGDAVNAARHASQLRDPDAEIALTVYDGALCYLVTLKSGDQGEAYFVAAGTGEIEKVVRSGSDQIDTAAKRAAQAPAEEPDNTPTPAETPVETIAENNDYNSDKENTPTPTTTATQSPAQTARLPYSTVPVTMKELSFVTLSPPNDAHELHYDILFEGQYSDTTTFGSNTGRAALIDSYGKWLSYIDDHSYAYRDKDGNTLDVTLDEAWFNRYVLIAADFDFKSGGNLNALTALYANNSSLYAELSLDYGSCQSGACCRATSLYAIPRSELPADCTLIPY